MAITRSVFIVEYVLVLANLGSLALGFVVGKRVGLGKRVRRG